MPRANRQRREKTKWESWLIAILCFGFVLSLLLTLHLFHKDNTMFVPETGGTYIEGSVGELNPLNPWFTVTNDVNRDIVSLIFSGLLKYNPDTQKIEEDLATMKVSTDGRIYTLTLKDDLYWHDSSLEYPHPITIDDVLFTFETIQHPKFPNSLLRQNFQGVEIEQLDDRSVRFKLEEPYRFFPSNLTIGLMPKDSFEGIPVDRIDQALDFGFHPIGAGPYKFKALVQTELSTEVSLERFQRSIPPTYHLERVVFRIFPDYSTLLSDIRNLHGVRLVPRNTQGEPLVPRSFTSQQYNLPQYVALFLNMQNEFLKDAQLRLALQLGTNKLDIVKSLNESIIVDTPLLEIDTSDWRYQYDQTAAQGALFNSDWHLPEKVRLQRLLEMREANRVGPLQLEPIVYLDTGATLTVTGSLIDVGSTGALLNELAIDVHPTLSGAWISGLPTSGTGGIQMGYNIVSLYDDKGDLIDSAYTWRTDDRRLFDRAAREQELLELFVESRAGIIPPEERITVFELFLDNGMLRRRLSTDPSDIRVNNKGQRLSLRLLTSASPPQYREIAEQIRTQWEGLGIHVGIEVPETRAEFEEKLLKRDYDVLLFGQSLLDNLDSYPYWHSSGLQGDTENKNSLKLDAYNLSQYSSFKADSLLEFIRKTGDETERDESLEELRDVLKEDVPAIFLYSPLYTFAYHKDLHGVELTNISLHSDRFLTLHHWYAQEKRVFKPGVGWGSIFGWIPTLFK